MMTTSKEKIDYSERAKERGFGAFKGRKYRMEYKPERFLERLKAMHRGDIYEVKWLDACKVRFVKDSEIMMSHVFATYKKVTGKFWGIIADPLYHKEYMVIITKDVDVNCYNIVSIPLSTVTNVKRLTVSMRMKTLTDVGTPFAQGSARSTKFEVAEETRDLQTGEEPPEALIDGSEE